MGTRDYYKHGDFNAICDVCGFKFKGSELKKRWDGVMVCEQDWEPRQQQDLIRGIKEDTSTPYSKPEATNIYPTGYVQALAGATTITSADLGTDNRVVVDVVQQLSGVYTQGAVTITIDNTITTGKVVIIKGVTSAGVSVTVINNSTGTVTQIA